MQTTYNKNLSIIKSMLMASMLLALMLITKALLNNLNFVLGYSIQFYLLFYLIAPFLIKNQKIKFVFFITAPILLLTLGFANNPIFDYLLYLYAFFPFFCFKTPKSFLKILVYFLISYFIAFWCNVISGVLFYEATFLFSLVFNLIFNLINFCVIFIFFIVIYRFIKGGRNVL